MKSAKTDESHLSNSSSEPGHSFIERMNACASRAGSVTALARKAGISQSGIRRYFAGGEPTRPHLVAIARAAKVSLAWLATGAGEPGASTPRTDDGLDLDRLEHVARTTFEELQRRGVDLDPAGQARLIRVLYRHFSIRQEIPDYNTISNIIDLAAYR